MPNTILGTRDIAVTWTDRVPAFMVFTGREARAGMGRAGGGSYSGGMSSKDLVLRSDSHK